MASDTSGTNKRPGKLDPKANLNKGKTCPECGKWHGNKTGGREGGTICGGIKHLTRPDGSAFTQKCTHLFTSTSYAKRRKLEESMCTESEACAPIKLSKAKNAFEKIKEKVIKERAKNGGFVYVAYLANLDMDRLTRAAAAKCNASSRPEEMQVLAQEGTVHSTGEEVSTCSALFQYGTQAPNDPGPLMKIFTNDVINVAIQTEFQSLVSENLRKALAEAVDRNARQHHPPLGIEGLGVGPEDSMGAGLRYPDLMEFLASIGKEACYDKLAEQNLDFATLQMSVEDLKHPMTPALLKDTIGIPLGDAYAIVRSVSTFAPCGADGIDGDPIVAQVTAALGAAVHGN